MKKTLVAIFAIALIATASIFAGGAQEAKPASTDGGLKGYLTVATNTSDPVFSAVQAVIDAFMEENPGVTVEYTTYGKDYENLMKAKMAANDLPDVFATHGWGVKRYAEYLMPLNDLSFAGRFTESIKNVITTEDGRIVTMPVTSEATGIIYNKDILAKAGWTTVPRTWAEFFQCCRDIRAIGIDPVLITGKDNRCQANLMDIAAPSILCSYEKENYQESLYDGTFDWSQWAKVAGIVKQLADENLTNKDANTADPLFASERLANGEACFYFNNQAYISNAWEINPDANLSMMPVPAYYEDDEQIMIGGERESYGIWKDTPNKEIAIALLEFMARPENVKSVGEACGMPNPFVDVTVDLRISKDLAQYNNLRTYPYFDREWLPSGMWATMRATGGAITAGDMTVEQACKEMEKNYLSLRAQN